MARKVKRKGPTKRVRLAAALREAMGPVMRAHGFDHPPKSKGDYSNIFPRADQWYRWVGDECQMVEAYWPFGHAPKFRLSWWDNRNMGGSDPWVTYNLQCSRPNLVFDSSPFGGLWPISHTVRRAMRRLPDLLTYWETGATTPYLGLHAPGRHFVTFDEVTSALPRRAAEPIR